MHPRRRVTWQPRTFNFRNYKSPAYTLEKEREAAQKPLAPAPFTIIEKRGREGWDDMERGILQGRIERRRGTTMTFFWHKRNRRKVVFFGRFPVRWLVRAVLGHDKFTITFTKGGQDPRIPKPIRKKLAKLGHAT